MDYASTSKDKISMFQLLDSALNLWKPGKTFSPHSEHRLLGIIRGEILNKVPAHIL
jgi:hypothetical protein